MKKAKVVLLAALAVCWLAGSVMAAETAEKEEMSSFDEAVQQFKHPTEGITLGFDQRLREIYANNFMTLSDDGLGHERQFQRFRSRLSANWAPSEDFSFNTRLVWEWRNWVSSNDGGPLSNSSSIEWDEAIFDRMNFSIKNPGGMPATLTVGRQDLIYGNGWLILDGTPLDGSRTIFFDAAKLSYNEDDLTTIDLVYIDQTAAADRWIEPFNDQEKSLMEQDERGAILYITNKSVENTEISAYYIWKHDMFSSPGPGGGNHPPTWANESDIHTVGARVAGKAGSDWAYRAEFAQEMGRQQEWGTPKANSLCAFGFNSRLTRLMNDDWKNNFYVGYEYLSGDDPDTDTDEGFDPLWGRWPQWSELYVYSYAGETRIGESSNFHRMQFGWQADPCKHLHLLAEYSLLFADENPQKNNPGYDKDGNVRGQLAVLKAVIKQNKYISHHVLAEFFFPGDYYPDSRNDMATFLRYELMFTF